MLINRELLTVFKKKVEECECDWPSAANGMFGWSLYFVWPFYTCPATLMKIASIPHIHCIRVYCLCTWLTSPLINLNKTNCEGPRNILLPLLHTDFFFSLYIVALIWVNLLIKDYYWRPIYRLEAISYAVMQQVNNHHCYYKQSQLGCMNSA